MRLRIVPLLVASALALTACTAAQPQVAPPAQVAAPSVCPPGTAQQSGLCLSDDDVADQLASILRSEFHADKLAAVIAGVWHDGKPVLYGALGDSMTGVPATPDMHHLLGNIATPMLTTVALQQAQAGVLSLDDKLSRWLPQLPSADAITIGMVLHNTSGYGQYMDQADFLAKLHANPFHDWTLDEILTIAMENGIAYAPGKDWLFSDTNTAVLAAVLEKATGKSAAELLQKGVFDPLGMHDTTAAFTADWPQPVLHGFDGERGVWEDVTNWSPTWAQYAGGLGSNVDDLHTFFDAFGSGALLSDAYYKIQLAPTTVGIGSNKADEYWAIGALDVHDWLFLNPNVPGYVGAGGTLPDEGWTMIVYTTASQATNPNDQTATDIFRKFTGVVSPDHAF